METLGLSRTLYRHFTLSISLAVNAQTSVERIQYKQGIDLIEKSNFYFFGTMLSIAWPSLALHRPTDSLVSPKNAQQCIRQQDDEETVAEGEEFSEELFQRGTAKYTGAGGERQVKSSFRLCCGRLARHLPDSGSFGGGKIPIIFFKKTLLTETKQNKNVFPAAR